MTTTDEITAMSNEALHAEIRRTGWKPNHLRQTVEQYDLPAEARAAVLAEADRLEALHPRLEAEMADRRRRAPSFRGYVA